MQQKYKIKGREATLYKAEQENAPLIVLNTFTGDGSSVLDELKAMGAAELNLLCVGNLNWNRDMSPWYCPPLSPQDKPCTGGADEYLKLLLTEIIPSAKEKILGTPSHISIAGYSLAGLFALYAMYQCDAFDRAASMSGSLWFPNFREYVLNHEMKRIPDKVYISLGDRESRTRNKLLRTVQENTEFIVQHYRELGMDVIWELNPGNHSRNAAKRSAKGILAIL